MFLNIFYPFKTLKLAIMKNILLQFQFYTELCVPFLMEKSDMSKILSCMREIQTIKVGNDYVTEKMSRADSLSLVLYGR
jgi:hypothetical protein